MIADERITPIIKEKDDKRPLYVLVYERLFDLIKEGYFPTGEKIPGEHTLAKHFGVSRGTLRQALLILQEDGVLHNAQGKGNYVAKNERVLGLGLEHPGSIPRLFVSGARECEVGNLKTAFETPNKMLQQELLITTSELVVVLHRVYIIEGEHACYLITFLPYSKLTEFSLNLDAPEEILHFTDERIYQVVTLAQTRILLTKAGDFIGEQLNIRVGTPLMLFEETMFQSSGEPLAFQKGYFRPEFFDFQVNRK